MRAAKQDLFGIIVCAYPVGHAGAKYAWLRRNIAGRQWRTEFRPIVYMLCAFVCV